MMTDPHAKVAAAPLLKARGLCKSFPGVRALNEVNLAVDRGEVLAVIGENGAGKSTLMKILAGVEQPDRGELSLDGKPVLLNDVRHATALGIALIHQELNLADNLSVAANVFLGREPATYGFMRLRSIRREAKRYLDQLGLQVPPGKPVRLLSIAEQQLVEIAKALSANARLLIMDEPTSSLSGQEAEKLFRVIGELKNGGVSIIYISHRLGEVKRLADRVLVLRDGENAGELSRDQIEHDTMVRHMVGRDISKFYPRRPHPSGGVLFAAERLRTSGRPQQEVSFEVRSGEIVGLAGLVGAGRTQLLRTLFGIDPAVAGTVRIAGRAVRFRSSAEAIRAGVALVPEDRRQQGLVVDMPVRPNISLLRLRHDSHPGGFISFGEERRLSREMIGRLNIKTPHDRQVVRYLSGGNQQKVALAKWLAINPKVLLLDEPTRGIDVGAKQEIYAFMEELAEQGMAVLFASSEMEEILGISDRVLVMHEGRITGELSREQLSEEAVMQLMTGNA